MIHPPSPNYPPPIPNSCPLTLCKRNHVNYICKTIVCMVKKGSDCAYPHPPMCFKYIKRGPKGCAKRTSYNFVHPKLRSNNMNATSNPQNKMHGSNYHPTPLMQVSVPPSHVSKPVSNAPQTNTVSPPAQTPISDPQPIHTTSFLEELKEIRSQMLQMQQTQNLLMQNMLNQMWPPLSSQKSRHLPNQMF